MMFLGNKKTSSKNPLLLSSKPNTRKEKQQQKKLLLKILMVTLSGDVCVPRQANDGDADTSTYKVITNYFGRCL